MTRRITLSFSPATLLAALVILLLSGCHSSRKVTSSGSSSSSGRPAANMTPSTIANQAVVTIADATSRLMKEADAWLGTPYRFGASERGKGADCSGLVIGVFANALNLKLPRSSRDQAEWCSPLGGVREAIPGDLVFFAPGGKGTVNHVGIYLGDGRFVHASSSRGVMVSSLDEPYFTRNYMSVGRVEPYFTLASKSERSDRADKSAGSQKSDTPATPVPSVAPAKPVTPAKAVEPVAPPAPKPVMKPVQHPDTILDAAEARRRLLLRLNETTDTTAWH